MVSSLRLIERGGFETCEFVPLSSEISGFEPSLIERGGFEACEFVQLSSEISGFDGGGWLRIQARQAPSCSEKLYSTLGALADLCG